jgi:3-oxoadipate enol-lactonase
LLESDARAYAASCRAAADLDLLTRLQAYQGPVLVVRGEQDSGVPLEAAQTLARAFANGRFEAIPGSGHNSPFENPEVFAELVLQFVRESEGALQR